MKSNVVENGNTMSRKPVDVENLIDRWIEPNPSKPGPAEWRIRGTGLPVWRVLGQFAVELGTDNPTGYREIVTSPYSLVLIDSVASYYDVAPEAIRAALHYVSEHLALVTARLVLDRAALTL